MRRRESSLILNQSSVAILLSSILLSYVECHHASNCLRVEVRLSPSVYLIFPRLCYPRSWRKRKICSRSGVKVRPKVNSCFRLFPNIRRSGLQRSAKGQEDLFVRASTSLSAGP